MTGQVQILRGEEGVEEASRRLINGECIALPTETVYGLAADAGNPAAVKAIFTAKGRPTDHPLIVHLASAAQLPEWASEVPKSAWQLTEAFWPGPLTLLLHKKSTVTTHVTGGLETIAVRAPSHPVFQAILEKTGLGLAAPSANRYKKLSPTTAEQVAHGMAGRISAVIDGGPCEFGLESTIIDLTRTTPAVLRAGPVTRAALEEALGQSVSTPENHGIAVPGNVEAHYQPEARLQRVQTSELGIAPEDSTAYLIWSDAAAAAVADFAKAGENLLHLPAEPERYGQALYTALHQLDQLDVQTILVEFTPTDESWAAVNDRLRRAAGTG